MQHYAKCLKIMHYARQVVKYWAIGEHGPGQGQGCDGNRRCHRNTLIQTRNAEKPMRFLTLIFCLLLPAFAQAETVTFADGRSYRIDLPDRPAGARVILGLHGGGGNPDQFARNSRLSQSALPLGYAVIYPQGTGRIPTWNIGRGYCCGAAERTQVDDVAFLDRVIADAGSRFGLSIDRVYLTGMSNGSMMSERYAANRPTRVAAVVGVSGTMDVGQDRLRAPVPLLAIHGTGDENVPYAGGRGPKTRGDSVFAGVEDVVDVFVRAAGQSLQGRAVQRGTVTRTEYTTARGAPFVSLIKIEGGTHVWPGGRRTRREPSDIDATAEALNFFAMHP